ncbi:olfactory receptor 2D2-like [Discoglossus pictus]
MYWKNQTVVTEFILMGLSSYPRTQTMLSVTFFNVYLIGLVGNLLIITAILSSKKLHTPMYFFLMNLSFLDICLSTTIVPRALKDLMSEKKVISYTECVAQMYFSLSLGESESILLAIMAYDRYIAICYPLHYTTIISKSVCIKIGAGTWICGFLLSISSVVLTFNVNLCGHNEINHFFCEQPEILSLACENVMAAEFVNYVLCVIIVTIQPGFIFITYIKIIITILSIKSPTGSQKALSTCGSHLLVVTLFYGSAMVAYMKPMSSSSTDTDKVMSVFYGAITPMLNPLIYSLRNKDVKGALWDIFRKNCKEW